MTEHEMPVEPRASPPPAAPSSSSKKRKCPPASPPVLELGASSAVLWKTWEFASSVERRLSRRTLAPPTGSRLEAQLLVSLIESGTVATDDAGKEEDQAPALLERSLSGIEPLPLVPGVTDEEWEQFRERAYMQ